MSLVLRRSLLIKIENVIVCMAIFSLLFWIMFELGVPTNSQLFIKWGGVHPIVGYYYLDFAAQSITHFLGINIFRNTGAFVEAPMFSYILTIAFLINLFVEKHNKLLNFKNVILLLTVFTTTSTTGLIVIICSLSYYEFCLNKNKIMKLELTKSLISLIIGISIIIVIVVILILVSKWNSMQGSVSIRFDDFIAGFKAWGDHPIFGNGLGNFDAIKHYMSPDRLEKGGNSGFSSGLMLVLSEGGIIYLLLYLIPTFYSFKNGFNVFGLAIFSFILFIFTIINDTYLYFLIIGYLWANIIWRSYEPTLDVNEKEKQEGEL